MKYINNKLRKAFTMLELIFVIVIMGIIGKFGVEFLAQSYKSFISSSENNRLQADTAAAVEFISSRLQYRIKASTIARETNATISPQYTLLEAYYNATAPVLEWIGADIDGFRGDTVPFWTGFIDLNTTATTPTIVRSPGTNLGQANTLIQNLSNANANINLAAMYFIDPESLPGSDGWGWDENITTFDNHTNVQIHPMRSRNTVTFPTDFVPIKSSDNTDSTLSGVRASEYYQLAWTAYAVGINDWDAASGTGTLRMWYNYRPWEGEAYDDDGTSVVIMEDVSSFRFISSGPIVKFQVCVKSDLYTDEEYSICKEKTVF